MNVINLREALKSPIGVGQTLTQVGNMAVYSAMVSIPAIGEYSIIMKNKSASISYSFPVRIVNYSTNDIGSKLDSLLIQLSHQVIV